MIDYLTIDLPCHTLLFEVIILLIILSNIWILRCTGRHTAPSGFPKVSILVPARNEERNIAACVHSLLAQEYPNFEVLVFDDQSSDSTAAILKEIAAANPKLRLLNGDPPPEGWVGKNWACAQLADSAQGDIFYFTDADTVHQPWAVRTAATVLLSERADLLTGFPAQRMDSWGERLIVPFFLWAFFSFTPLALAYRLRLPWLSNAVGQFMVFRREAYVAIGGHRKTADSITEDLRLAQRMKAHGLRWRVINAAGLLSCRMYAGFAEAWEGFSKNLFAAFGFRLLPYLFVFVWLAVLFYLPPGLLLGYAAGAVSQGSPLVWLLCIALALLIWLLPYRQLRLPLYLAFLYPLTLFVNELVALRSLWASLRGALSWKGRQFAPQRWRWV
ncbi:MAG: glycosyltransferase [Anaerolineales bacterium]|jgi:chlorobactene glucosyltransferase